MDVTHYSSIMYIYTVYVIYLNIYAFSFEWICAALKCTMIIRQKQGVREPNFFQSLFFKHGWAVIWQRVKHSKVRNTSLILSFLPAILPSAWRDKFQLFLQVNTPVFFENETGRGGCLFFASGQTVSGCFMMETAKVPVLLFMIHPAVTPTCLQKPLTGWSSWCIYLRAIMLKQTCSWRIEHQRQHERPVLMSTHTPLMTKARSVIIIRPHVKYQQAAWVSTVVFYKLTCQATGS